MSKPSTTSSPKASIQLPHKSAWARGPPQTSTSTPTVGSQWLVSSPRDAMKIPAQMRSKRSNASGRKGITVKDGLTIPLRGSIGALKQNSMTFGSINENPKTLPTPLANIPLVKSDGIILFGSIPAVTAKNNDSEPLPPLVNRHGGQSSSVPDLLTATIPSTATMSAISSSAPNNIPQTSPPAVISQAGMNPSPSTVLTHLPSKLPTTSSTSNPTIQSDLSYQNIQNNDTTSNLTSNLATARVIEYLGRISYPLGIVGPKPELNMNSKKGKFIYDREFLLQFTEICTEKPSIPLGLARILLKSPPPAVVQQAGLNPLPSTVPTHPQSTLPTTSSTANATVLQGFPFPLNPQNGNPAPEPKSSLATARIIEDLSRISYPEGIKRPEPELNVYSKKGKFIYDRYFLLQFMEICTEKPDAPLDMINPQSRRQVPHRTNNNSPTPSGFTMGNFSASASKVTRSAKPQGPMPRTAPNPEVSSGRQDQGVPRVKRTRSKRGGVHRKLNNSPAGCISNNQGVENQAALPAQLEPLEEAIDETKKIITEDIEELF